MSVSWELVRNSIQSSPTSTESDLQVIHMHMDVRKALA